MNYEFNSHQSEKDLHPILKILSFLIPLLGILIYLKKRNIQRKAASSACEMAIGGFFFFIFLKMLLYAYETRNGYFFK